MQNNVGAEGDNNDREHAGENGADTSKNAARMACFAHAFPSYACFNVGMSIFFI